MTIFDSIRYPIPDNADWLDMSAIPPKIHEKWVSENTRTTVTVSIKGRVFTTVMFPSQEDLKQLRKIILEYEE